MGVFSLLYSCCVGRPKRYKETLVEYSYVPYGPSANEIGDTSPKEQVVDSTKPAKEPTPPPHYSVNSLSKVKTIVSSAPTDPSPSALPEIKKEEKSEVAPRVIKPLRQRREKGARFSTDDLPLRPYPDKGSVQEQKTLLQTPLPPSLYEKKEEPAVQPLKDKRDETAESSKPAQPFTFAVPDAYVKAKDIAESSSAPPETTKATPAALTAIPPPATTIFDRLAAANPRCVPAPPTTTSPPSPLTLHLFLAPPPPPPTTTTPKPPPPPPTTTTPTPSLGLICPQCHAPNKLLTTHAQNLNHLRPYRKCSRCAAWNGFADSRGLDPSHPCDCDPPHAMRLVAMNKQDARGRRQAFYSCQFKACGAWSVARGAAGEARWFTRDEVEALVAEGGI